MASEMGMTMSRRRCSFFQAVVFAGPFVMEALGQLELMRDAVLRIFHGGGEVATADAELDGNVTAIVLAVDHEGAVVEVDICDLTKRNAAAVGSGDGELRMASGILAEFRLVADDEIEATVAIENFGRSYSANGCLHG